MLKARSFQRACGCAAVGAILLLSSSAIAADKVELAADAAKLPILNAVLHPSQNAPGGFSNRGPGCPPTTSSHTNASFTGGSYVAQGGFSETEIAAASYVIPASAFPIHIDQIDFILATSGANVQTVTQYSVIIWQGTPATGLVVSSNPSDDVILPYARIGPGTAGLDIRFSVDPTDPDQSDVLVSDDGTHTFSIGLRIDHHNQQAANPCFTAPPTCCNAFPVTDVGGLQQPTNNWLYGVNCGSFGCPANGGWAKFNQLPGPCRPTGDWVMQALWTSVNCVPPSTGACCAAAGTCTSSTQAACSGVYQGDSTVCSPNPCPQPTGACCTSGVCSTTTAAQCAASFQGAGTTCAGTNCPQPTGACCFGPSSCQVLDSATCTGFGGSYIGNSVACGSGGVCPLGACCLPNGSCLSALSQPQCAGQGGVFQGVGSACSPNNCPQPTGACCNNTSGFCGTLTQAACANIPNTTWRGPLTACTPNPCGQTGACCTATACSITSGSACSGTFQGSSTACGPAGNPTTCCKANFNQAGGVTVQDIFDYLAAYFAGTPSADFNGVGGVTVQDIFDFLSAYFTGCPG